MREAKVYGFIYVIINNLNGKQYVGQTTQGVNKRFNRHCWCSTVNNMPIDLAIRKYGRENFQINVLAECSSQERLDEEEIKFATTLDTFVPNGYNLKAGNGRGVLSKELKEKIRLGSIGKHEITEDTRKKLSDSHIGIYPNINTKKKLSDLHIGSNNAFFGKHHTDETRAKLRKWWEDNREDGPLSDRALYSVKKLMGFQRNGEEKFVPTEQARRIKQMHDSGILIKEICKIENISKSGLYKLLKNLRRMEITNNIRKVKIC